MPAGHRRWTNVCAIVRNEHRPCHLCGQAIDYSLRWPNPRSFSGDHLTPTSQGGLDVYANCGASHLSCNCARHDDPLPALGLNTSRQW